MVNNQVKRRLSAVRGKMRETNTGLVAIGPGSHMDWLVGFHPYPDERPTLLLVGSEREAFLMPSLNVEGTREFTDIPFHTWSDDQGAAGALADALQAIDASAPGRVALDETMRTDFALLLLDALPSNTDRGFTSSTVGDLRMRKDAHEYEKLKMNAGIADRALQVAFEKMRPGMTERDLAGEIHAHFVSEGAEPFFLLVGAGGNGAFPHHAAGDRIIQEGDAVVIDIGGRKEGYPSDITRMAILGRPPEGYAEVYAVVERAVQAALAAVRPGVAAKEVDQAARSVIAEAGYGKYFVHRTGHGLGIDVHEPPYISAASETVLEEGMVFSIEPGIYLPGRFGIRLEEIVILRTDGPEIFSSLGREVRKVPVKSR